MDENTKSLYDLYIGAGHTETPEQFLDAKNQMGEEVFNTYINSQIELKKKDQTEIIPIENFSTPSIQETNQMISDNNLNQRFPELKQTADLSSSESLSPTNPSESASTSGENVSISDSAKNSNNTTNINPAPKFKQSLGNTAVNSIQTAREKLGLETETKQAEEKPKAKNTLLSNYQDVDYSIPLSRLTEIGADDNDNPIYETKDGQHFVYRNGQLVIPNEEGGQDFVYGKDFKINKHGLTSWFDEAQDDPEPAKLSNEIPYLTKDSYINYYGSNANDAPKPISALDYNDQLLNNKENYKPVLNPDGSYSKIDDGINFQITSDAELQRINNGIQLTNQEIRRENDIIKKDQKERIYRSEQLADVETQLKKEQLQKFGKAVVDQYDGVMTPEEVQVENDNLRVAQMLRNGEALSREDAISKLSAEKENETNSKLAESKRWTDFIVNSATQSEENRKTSGFSQGAFVFSPSERNAWLNLSNDPRFGEFMNSEGKKIFGDMTNGLEYNVSETYLRKQLVDKFLTWKQTNDKDYFDVLQTRDKVIKSKIKNALDKGDLDNANEFRKERLPIQQSIGTLGQKMQSTIEQNNQLTSDFDYIKKESDKSAVEYAGYKNGDFGDVVSYTSKSIGGGLANIATDIIGGVIATAGLASERASNYASAFGRRAENPFNLLSSDIFDQYTKYEKNGKQYEVRYGKVFEIKDGKMIFNQEATDNLENFTKTATKISSGSDFNIANTSGMLTNQVLMIVAPVLVAGKVASLAGTSGRLMRASVKIANYFGENSVLGRTALNYTKATKGLFSSLVWGEQTFFDNVETGKQAGLNQKQAWAYGMLQSLGTMVLIHVSPDEKILGAYKQFNPQAFKLISQNKWDELRNIGGAVAKVIGRSNVAEGAQETTEQLYMYGLNAIYNSVAIDDKNKLSTGNLKEWGDLYLRTGLVTTFLSSFGIATKGRLNLTGKESKLEQYIIASQVEGMDNYLNEIQRGSWVIDRTQQVEEARNTLATVKKYIAQIPSDSKLHLSETASVVERMQKIDTLKTEQNKTQVEGLKSSIQNDIDTLNGEIETILTTAKQRTANETTQSAPQQEAPQEQTANTENQSEQGTPSTEQNTEGSVENPEIIQQKIKNKNLFKDGGLFANILGGSGVDSVLSGHQERNGIEFIQWSNPNTGDVDVIMTGTGSHDFVGYYRIYENGKPTNKWSSKFENQSRNKDNFKLMISGVQELLPSNHQYTEKTSISSDGLRVWEQQLRNGYEIARNQNGEILTNEVSINGDSINNDLGINVNPGQFLDIEVNNEQDFQNVKKALLPKLIKLGLNDSNIRWDKKLNTVKIDLPILQKIKTTSNNDNNTQNNNSEPQQGSITEEQNIPSNLNLESDEEQNQPPITEQSGVTETPSQLGNTTTTTSENLQTEASENSQVAELPKVQINQDIFSDEVDPAELSEEQVAESDNQINDAVSMFESLNTPSVENENNVAENPISETENVQQNPVNQNSRVSTNGKYNVVESTDSDGRKTFELLDINNKPVKVSSKTKDVYVAEYINTQEYPETEIEFEDGMNENDVNQEIISKSNNPKEIAQVIATTPRFDSDAVTGSKEWAIAQVIGRNNVSRDSFTENDDANNITNGIARTYFGKNKSGKSLDNIAQEASEQFTGDYNGDSVTIQDVVDFIKKYPNDPSKAERPNNPVYDAAVEKFIQLTGQNPTKNLLDKLNPKQESTELNLVSAEAEYDLLSAEAQNNLQNEYDQLFNSLPLEQKTEELQKTFYENENDSQTTSGQENNSNENESQPNRQGEGNQNVGNEETAGKQEIKFNIIPFKANKNNSAKFKQAEKMFAKGEPLEKIWRDTGFFLRKNTKDGTFEWAYRIDQNKMNVKLPTNMKVGDTFKLSDVVDYPEFFAIFPDAKNFNVSIVNNKSNPFELGINPEKGIFTINLAYYDQNRNTESNKREKVAHELQHFVQHQSEGGGGTNLEQSVGRALDGIRRTKSEIESIIKQGTLSPIEEQSQRKELERLNAMEKYLNSGKRTDYWVEKIANDKAVKYYDSHLGEREARLAETYYKESPYSSYNKDAEHIGITATDFEAETQHLRNLTQNQKTNQKFSLILKPEFDALIEKLKKPFSKAFKNLNITTDWNAFLEKAKALGLNIYFNSQFQIDPNARKQKQLALINKTNPAPNDYNTWIRSEGDILTAEEAFSEAFEDGEMYPDFTVDEMQEAIDSGEITIYSSRPIEEGSFITPSKMNAEEYAGGPRSKVYSKKVKITDIAWIDQGEGQFAPIQFMHNKNGEVYGAKLPDGTIYINPNKLNANTAIHEFSHLWEQVMPNAWKKGLELFKETSTGKKLFNQLKSEGNYSTLSDDLIWSEALNTHIGNIGEQQYQNPKGKMKEFVDWFKTTMAKFLNAVGIKNNWTKETNLSAFTDTVLGDLMGERELDVEGNTENGHPDFQIIGERGAANLDKMEEATTRLDNLGKAREMETSGKSPLETRLATGWEKGVDGKWRYEIKDLSIISDDATVSGYNNLQEWFDGNKRTDGKLSLINFAGITSRQTRREAINNAKNRGFDITNIFDAYPKISEINIELSDVEGSKGSYNPITNTITLNKKLSFKEADSTLIHEIQHAVQEIEGFARGGNTKMMNTPDSDLQKLASPFTFPSLPREQRLKAKEIARKKGIRFSENFYFDVVSDDIDVLEDAIENLEILNEVSPNDIYLNLINALDNKIASMQGENLAYKKYQRLAGETEARNVQTRANMSMQERRATLLSETEDVAREDQIILMNGLGLSESNTGSSINKKAMPKSTFAAVANATSQNGREAGYQELINSNWFKSLRPEVQAGITSDNFQNTMIEQARIIQSNDKIARENIINKTKEKGKEAVKKVKQEAREKIKEIVDEYKDKIKTLKADATKSAREKSIEQRRILRAAVKDIKSHLASSVFIGKITPTEANRLIRKASELGIRKDLSAAVEEFTKLYDEIKNKAESRIKQKEFTLDEYNELKPIIEQLKNSGMSLDEVLENIKNQKLSNKKAGVLNELYQNQIRNIYEAAGNENLSPEKAYEQMKEKQNESVDAMTDRRTFSQKAKQLVRTAIKLISDRQYLPKKLLQEIGAMNTKSRMVAMAGSSARARMVFDDLNKKIFDGLKAEDKSELNAMIVAKRILSIEKNRAERGLPPMKHPYANPEQALKGMKDKLGAEKFADLENRANEYFKAFKGILTEMRDNGLISQDAYESMIDIDYQPRLFIDRLLDADGNLDPDGNFQNFSGQNGGLKSEILKSLGDGSDSAIIDNAEWLLKTALASRYKAMAMNEVNRRFMTDEFWKAKDRFDAIDPKNFKNKAEEKFYNYFKELQAKIKDNPIVGTTEIGNPKYRYDTAPQGFTKAYYYVDGIKNEFFLADEFHKEWHDVKEGLIFDPKAKGIINKYSGAALIKAMATGYNPTFAFTNTPRDFMQTLVFSPEYSNNLIFGTFQLGKDQIKSVIRMFKEDFTGKEDAILQKYLEYGGGMDFLYVQGLADKDRKLHNSVRKVLDSKIFEVATLMKLSKWSEMMTRMAIFERSIKNQLKELGLKDINQITNQEQQDDIYYNAVNSARSIMDFNQGGKLVKDLDAIMPYLNAATQGTRVAIDAFRERPLDTSIRMFQAGGLMASTAIGMSYVLLAMAKGIGGDDDEKSISENILNAYDGLSQYQRANYINIVMPWKNDKGEYHVFKIAKTQFVAPLSYMMEEGLLNVMRKTEGKEEKDFMKIMKETGWVANKNMTPIEMGTPDRMITSIATKNPLMKASLTYTTGYDFFKEEVVTFDVKKSNFPKELEGYKAQNVEDFYKEIGSLTGGSPARMKAFVESIVTTPETNPFVTMMYGGADLTNAVINGDSKSEVASELKDNISKVFTKRLIGEASDFNRMQKQREKVEKEVEEAILKDEKLKYETDILAKKLAEGKINDQYITDKFNSMGLKGEERVKANARIDKKMKSKASDNRIYDIMYSTSNSARAKAILIRTYFPEVYENSTDGQAIRQELKNFKLYGDEIKEQLILIEKGE